MNNFIYTMGAKFPLRKFGGGDFCISKSVTYGILLTNLGCRALLRPDLLCSNTIN